MKLTAFLLLLFTATMTGCATMATSPHAITRCRQQCFKDGLSMWQYKDGVCQCQGNKIVPMTTP